ncbi:17160_t:CDS:2 [Funneliformis caledonium]|uniref:17160_t:CDS:1 n=1 Tax=Funneliformis caledonium TaxID=1117310 RepID=A0A9N8YNI6_9GLOM|nr:17160_t:CDS:2 [Funneliformis caledonium]
MIFTRCNKAINHVKLKNNFVSLHSCVIVNRHWCTLALPELWKNPFDAINISNLKVVANIPLLNTYVSCLSKDIRDNLGDDDPVVFKLKSKTKKRKVSIEDGVDNILKALCEYFVDRSALWNSINCGAVSSAAKIAKNIERLDIDLRDAPFPTMITSLSDIVELIKSQKNLKKIALCCSVLEFSEIIKSLSIHHETLTHITLHHIEFERNFPLAELAEYLNLNYLEIENCKFIRGKMIKLGLKSFQKLHSILIKNTNLPFEMLEFLCCQANSCLQVLELSANSDFDRLENVCLKFCPNIKKFVTTKISSYDNFYGNCLQEP